jgi:catechol-2,3-dioxygenase
MDGTVAALGDTSHGLLHALRRHFPLGEDNAQSRCCYLRDRDQNGVELYWDRPEARGINHSP